MDCLWALIQDEAQAIDGYYKAIHELKEGVAEHPENSAAIDLLLDIIGEEEDHLNGLQLMFDAFTKTPAEANVTTKAKKLVSRIMAKKVMEESKNGAVSV